MASKTSRNSELKIFDMRDQAHHSQTDSGYSKHSPNSSESVAKQSNVIEASEESVLGKDVSSSSNKLELVIDSAEAIKNLEKAGIELNTPETKTPQQLPLFTLTKALNQPAPITEPSFVNSRQTEDDEFLVTKNLFLATILPCFFSIKFERKKRNRVEYNSLKNLSTLKYPFLTSSGFSEENLLPKLVGNRITLVLDMDETLIHSSATTREGSLKRIVYGNNEMRFIHVRPGLTEFLEFASKEFELVVWTASLKSYADPILDYIDPKKLIKNRLYRDSCSMRNNQTRKDLGRLGRRVEKLVIVDNTKEAFEWHQDNAILIESFMGGSEGRKDQRLKELQEKLKTLISIADVRTVLNKQADSAFSQWIN